MKVKMNGGMSLKISSLLFRAKGVSKILMQQNWIPCCEAYRTQWTQRRTTNATLWTIYSNRYR